MKPVILEALTLALYRSLHGTTRAERRRPTTEDEWREIAHRIRLIETGCFDAEALEKMLGSVEARPAPQDGVAKIYHFPEPGDGGEDQT
jgi:hypothetical protein